MGRKEIPQIDISEIHGVPDLVRIAEEVQKTGEPLILKRDQEQIAQITSVKPSRTKTKRSPRHTSSRTGQDSILNIIGIAESDEPTDIARHKQRYIAEAYESMV